MLEIMALIREMLQSSTSAKLFLQYSHGPHSHCLVSSRLYKLGHPRTQSCQTNRERASSEVRLPGPVLAVLSHMLTPATMRQSALHQGCQRVLLPVRAGWL